MKSPVPVPLTVYDDVIVVSVFYWSQGQQVGSVTVATAAAAAAVAVVVVASRHQIGTAWVPYGVQPPAAALMRA